MPGSGDSDGLPDGNLVDAARPTLDEQLVDAANAAIEKIRQKAAVAQGSWIKWFGPSTSSEAAGSRPEKSEAPTSGASSTNGELRSQLEVQIVQPHGRGSSVQCKN